jgi:hypothetical protein
MIDVAERDRGTVCRRVAAYYIAKATALGYAGDPDGARRAFRKFLVFARTDKASMTERTERTGKAGKAGKAESSAMSAQRRGGRTTHWGPSLGGCARASLVALINGDRGVLPHLAREIGVEVRASEKSEERKGLDAFLDDNGCSMKIDPVYVCVVVARAGEQPIAVLLLEPTQNCMYITYFCVARERRGEGWGVFLGFLAVYFGLQCGSHHVISTGISKQMIDADYTRVGGTREIVLSQYLQIAKLGFVDLWKEDGYSNERLMHMQDYCDGTPETALDLRDGNLRMYEEYKASLLRNARGVFASYLSKTGGRTNIEERDKDPNEKERVPLGGPKAP